MRNMVVRGSWLVVRRWWLVGALVLVAATSPIAQRAAISDKPDTPFRLATFDAAGKTRVGIVLQTRVLDIAGANDALTRSAGVSRVAIPGEMRELIEAYDRVKPRLYQIANYYAKANADPSFAFDLAAVSLKA